MPHGITKCYLPSGRGDVPALTPAEAGTRLSDPGGMQGGVDLVRGGGAVRAVESQREFVCCDGVAVLASVGRHTSHSDVSTAAFYSLQSCHPHGQ